MVHYARSLVLIGARSHQASTAWQALAVSATAGQGHRPRSRGGANASPLRFTSGSERRRSRARPFIRCCAEYRAALTIELPSAVGGFEGSRRASRAALESGHLPVRDRAAVAIDQRLAVTRAQNIRPVKAACCEGHLARDHVPANLQVNGHT